MSGWRVWLAFEVRTGITAASLVDRSATWRGLAEACRGADGRIDAAEFERWTDCIVERVHLWGHA